MKTHGITVIACLAMVLTVSVCTADWTDGMPHKWVQHPDLTVNGVDVKASVAPIPSVILADDFLCDSTGPITNIHIWGSWLNDVLPGGDPQNVEFALSIHADIPAGQTHSMPGDPLWIQTFRAGQFAVRPESQGVPEWWYDPATGAAIPGADQVCWQYNFDITNDLFVQRGTLQAPVVYWLNVQAQPLDQSAQFGWKTSVDHWNDQATYVAATEPYTGPWNMLEYPDQHPQYRTPLDLAFVIVTSNAEDAVEIDDFADSGAEIDLVHSDGSSEAVSLVGTSAMHVFFDGPSEGDASDDDQDGFDEVPTEMVYMSLTGSSSGGPVTLGIWTNVPAMGQIEEQTNATPGLLEVLPFTTGGGEFWVDSFFDIFFEIEIDGRPLVAAASTRMQGVHSNKPPAQGESYTNAAGGLVPLLDEAGQPTEWSLRLRELTPDLPPELDFGDAPDRPYPTLLANDGARHAIGGPWFGDVRNAPDADADGQPLAGALGDDSDGNDDELGVWFLTPIERGIPNTNVQIIVSGGGGGVAGWIDFNGDGVWSTPGEQVVAASFPDGTNYITITAPSNSPVGGTYSRWRINTAGGLSPIGAADDGEVEDHALSITNARVNWGQIQYPTTTVTVVVGTPVDVYGRVYHAGITEPAGQGAGITAQLGYGPDGTAPGTAAWTWTPATYNTDIGNDDEYMATISGVGTGRYDFAYRFTRNGVDWLYVDNPPGAADGYSQATTGDLIVFEPLDLCAKWVQPPDCDYGLDLPSYAQSSPQGGEMINWYRVADDWICDGRPIDGIRWWGSYPGWVDPIPPQDEPIGRPVGFHLIWYADIPTDAPENRTGYSMPGEELAEVFTPLAPWGQVLIATGQVAETYYCTVSNKQGDLSIEHEYEYVVEFQEPWNEKDGRIYWLSIQAVYIPDYAPGKSGPEWGWKTSTAMDIIDDAVVWPEADIQSGLPVWSEMVWPEYPYLFLFYPPHDDYGLFTDPANAGPSLNMAFELLTDVCPRRATKWSQMPDMVEGTDMWSWRYLEEPVGSTYLRADDFVSDGRRITDIHWWGSYSNWMSSITGDETHPIDPPGTNFFLRPLGFNLSWHAESPAGECVPGPELTNVFVRIEDCHEMYYGTVFQSWISVEPPYYEHEYQYYVDLLDVAEPWYDREGGHYWLNIEAVFNQGFRPIEEQNLHGGWGWKITERAESPCFSVQQSRPAGPWEEALLPRNHPQGPVPFDLAFELTTDEVGPEAEIVITNIAMAAVGPASTVSSLGTSGAGTQYLQTCTNLLTTNWVPVLTNPVPYPLPVTNTWTHGPGGLAPMRFYRVIEK